MLLFAVFGMVSFWAPAAMMKFTASLGLDSVSGDYAYRQYERSGDLSYLARSFIVAANQGSDRTAETRFTAFYGNLDTEDENALAEGRKRREAFYEFCGEQDAIVVVLPTGTISSDYRCFVCSQAARVKYRLASSPVGKQAVCDFAIEETEESFPAGNPVIALAVSIADKKDKPTSEYLLEALSRKNYDSENTNYKNIKTILEAVE